MMFPPFLFSLLFPLSSPIPLYPISSSTLTHYHPSLSPSHQFFPSLPSLPSPLFHSLTLLLLYFPSLPLTLPYPSFPSLPLPLLPYPCSFPPLKFSLLVQWSHNIMFVEDLAAVGQTDSTPTSIATPPSPAMQMKLRYGQSHNSILSHQEYRVFGLKNKRWEQCSSLRRNNNIPTSPFTHYLTLWNAVYTLTRLKISIIYSLLTLPIFLFLFLFRKF